VFPEIAICNRFRTLVTASRLTLPKKGNVSLLNATMNGAEKEIAPARHCDNFQI
jgi:hypothetical protein